MSETSLTFVLLLDWGAQAVSRLPPVGWCSALGCANPSHLLDVACGWMDGTDLGELEPA